MADVRGRNEGAEPDLSYQPPKSMKKVTSIDEESTSAGFEWESLDENPDVDIWAVRIPAGFKASDLTGLKIKLPTNGTGNVSGTLKKGNISFNLRTVGGEDTSGGGEEMQNLRCMAPKESESGSLYQVPKPIKHFILTPQDPIPTPTSALAPPAQPPRRPQPIARLKHTFTPIGAAPLSAPSSSRTMDVGQEVDTAETESPKKKHKKKASGGEVVAVIPDKKGKGKVKEGASAPEVNATEEAMEVDNVVEAKPTKKPKKKDAAATGPEPQEEGAIAKKEKKKRKAAGSD
ncbi:hypothetical protein BDV93DRAFT_517854 [Ceratobasidium sp. AG-I]|nr:hypothetical protein BDV93DRAFT_517854 [Ceratobasidium sp. AG-I]